MSSFAKFILLSAIAVLLSGCASDNPIYRGQVQNGLPHGHGWKEWPTGEKYDGEWRDGQITGRGVLTWPNGNRAEGQFLNGKLNGNCVMTYADGSRYEGSWQDGVRSGHGVMKYADNNRYDGYWVNGEPSGAGAFESKNGNLYIGNFVNGKASGDGVATAFFYEQDGKWCINNCTETSTKFAIVAGEFPASDSNSSSVVVTQCNTDQIKCQTLLAPALLAFQKERARKLELAEKERARLAAEAEREQAKKDAAILAEKKRLADLRQRFLHETGTAAQLYMDADQLESSKDFIRASEVYRIVVTRFPESSFSAAAMTRLGAMRDKRDQQEADAKRLAAEEKKSAADAEARGNEAQLRKEDIAARKAEAEARRSEAAAAAASAQNNRNNGGGVGRSLACIACDQLEGFAKTACKMGACN